MVRSISTEPVMGTSLIWPVLSGSWMSCALHMSALPDSSFSQPFLISYWIVPPLTSSSVVTLAVTANLEPVVGTWGVHDTLSILAFASAEEQFFHEMWMALL